MEGSNNMSHSYKHNPIVKFTSRKEKRIANKLIRNYNKELKSGRMYKKAYRRQLINDYVFYMHKDDDWYEKCLRK